MAVRRIGQILVDLGFITDDQLQLLLEEQQQQPGALLGKLAEDMALITDEQLAQALAEQQGMRVVTLSEMTLSKDLLDKLTESMAQLYRVVPIKFEHNRLTVATCDPQNLSIQDELGLSLVSTLRWLSRLNARSSPRSNAITRPKAKASKSWLLPWQTTRAC